MDKNYQYYNNKGKYNDVCIPGRREVLKYLIKEKYLSEFSTDEEKQKVLDNLGITGKLSSILSIINQKSIVLKNLSQQISELYTSIDEKANSSDLNQYVPLIYFLKEIEKLKPQDEKSKGYFSSLEDLLLEFPTAKDGDWALVNVSGTWYVYRWSDSFGWVQTETYDNSIDLSEYVKRHELSIFQRELISGENIRTINGQSILGSGNITINTGGSGEGSSVNLEDYFTIPEIEELLSQLRIDILSKCNKQGFKIVDTFPTVNINNNLIYLLREDEHSPYKQYVHDDDGWHLLGSLELNLDGYLRESDIKALNGQSLVGNGNINLMSAHGVALTESGDLDNYYVTKEEFYDMQNPYKATISVSPSLSEYTGGSISITITVNGKKGLVNVPSTYNIYRNNQQIGTDSTIVDRVTYKGKYTYKVVATSEDGKSASAQTDVNIVLPTYYGFSQETNINNLDLSTLTKEVRLSITMNKTLENTVAGSYLYIVTPLSVNAVATDPGFTYKVKMILIDSIDGLNYYRSNSAIDISDLTYYIK